jgi:branched-subunit amino acid aminotransferase/4-amino-4-deoxychorismate lyase
MAAAAAAWALDAAGGPYVVADAAGAAAPCAQAAGGWLAAAPRGAYTAARTVGGANVFQLSFHLDRLASSAALMASADAAAAAAAGAPPPPPPPPADALRPAVLRSMRAAVEGFRAAGGDPAAELKLTTLVTWGAGGWAAATHAQPLGGRPTPPVRALVRGAPRRNAAAKDSDWVRERGALEAGRPADVNEILLATDAGEILEGLSSNFYALTAGGALQTAGEGVLAGSVRAVVLAAAARLGVPVDLAPPRVADVEAWQGAFVSSTSRLLLFVDEVAAPEAAPPRRKAFAKPALAARLEAAVAAELASASESVFEEAEAGVAAAGARCLHQ